MSTPLFRFVVILIAAQFLQAPPAAAAESTDTLRGKKVLFIIQPQGPHRATDDRIAQYLQSLGATVSIAGPAEPPGAAQGKDLVLISATVDDAAGAAALRAVAVPVITCESAALPALGMTLADRGVAYGTTEQPDTYLSMANTPHPLSAGIAAGTFVATNVPVPMTWGTPALAASIIATPPGYPGKAAIFAYERGATMADGLPAPARRVGFFFTDESFDKLEARAEGRLAQGLPLFAAALRWAVSGPVAPQSAPSASVHKGKKLLLVTQKTSSNAKPEVRAAVTKTNEAMLQHFASLGFTVTMAGNENDPATLADGQDLVVIAATIRANRILGRYRNVTVPVVNLENDILDDMSMTARRRRVDFGEVEGRSFDVVNAPHPLAAGLSSAVEVYQADGAFGFGLPGAGATVVATVPGEPGKSPFFAYEKGATMDYDFLAPARRVYFAIDFDSFEKLSASGLKLFDAALFWALGSPAAQTAATP